jgi:hypothetical protein
VFELGFIILPLIGNEIRRLLVSIKRLEKLFKCEENI